MSDPLTAPYALDALLGLGAADEAAFDHLAEAAFRFQQAANPVYAAFSEGAAWRGWRAAPFLPVEAFKLAEVAAFDAAAAQAEYHSSGTGQGASARRLVADLGGEHRLSAEAFARLVGPGPYVIAAHLPGYAARGAHSSLVSMARHFVTQFGAAGSTFFLDDAAPFAAALDASRTSGTPLLLLGAAFGLLGLVEARSWTLPEGARVIETGGMKTHRREIARADLHARLAEGFGVPLSAIGSEYGMCELASQAWARTGEHFETPPWMRVQIVDPADPTRALPDGTPGQLAVCDLAALHNSPFLLTEDQAVCDGRRFRVLGRLPKAALRGCNFLVEAAPRG